MNRFYIAIILVLVWLAAIGGCWFFFKKWKEEKAQIKNLIALSGQSDKATEFYRNRYNREVEKSSVIELNNQTLKKVLKTKQFEKPLRQFKKVKLRKLEGIGQITGTLVSSDTIDLQVGKSKIFFGGDSLNKWSLSRIDSNTVVLKDSTIVPLTVIVYWHRKWFLGKKSLSVEAASENPKVKLSGLKVVIRKN